LASGSDLLIRVWDLSEGRIIKTLSGHSSWISSVSFNSSGERIISGSADATIKLWDVSSGEVIRTFSGHTLRVNTIAYTGKDRIISGSEDGDIRIWNEVTGVCESVIKGQAGPIRAVAVIPGEGMFASCGEDKTIRLWEINTGKCINVINANKKITALAFNDSGSILAAVDEGGAMTMWRVDSMETIAGFSNQRMYENMNITSVTGLSDRQQENLKTLGAIDLHM
jgi:WD40 repeat protein